VPARRAVVAAVPDGRGGWFVGGSFTRLGGQPRVALARLLPSGAVDPAWRASIGSASGRPVAIYALARAGSRLFVAGPSAASAACRVSGSFGQIGGVPRNDVAALDPRTGALDAGWRRGSTSAA
jgi:hypothetical protein